MKNFNLRVFVISSIVIASLSYPSFYVVLTNFVEADGFFITIAEIIAFVFGFPFFMLALILHIEASLTTAFILLFLDILLYALLIERLFLVLKKRKETREQGY